MPDKQPKVLLSLGRTGDLVNCLAIARHFAAPTIPFAYCASHTNLMLSAPYVERVPLRIPPNSIDRAMAILTPRFESVVNLHCFGPHYRGSTEHPHNVRSFLEAGLTVDNFYDRAGFPLVFKRDADREAFLVKRHIRGNKPVIALAIGCAHSSPFASHRILSDSIRRTFPHAEVVDLCRINAPRFADLLGILDRSVCLVTADSGIMHLASATSTPVIYLHGENPITVAEPRYKPALRMRYSEAVRRAREVHSTLLNFLIDHRQ